MERRRGIAYVHDSSKPSENRGRSQGPSHQNEISGSKWQMKTMPVVTKHFLVTVNRTRNWKLLFSLHLQTLSVVLNPLLSGMVLWLIILRSTASTSSTSDTQQKGDIPTWAVPAPSKVGGHYHMSSASLQKQPLTRLSLAKSIMNISSSAATHTCSKEGKWVVGKKNGKELSMVLQELVK